ncbi:hypothetical protein ACX93W_10830 [Paenibacillus sp. CAU 1782]
MKIVENSILILDENDISSFYCYRDLDGMPYRDSFQFELKLQKVVIPPGSITGVRFQSIEEDDEEEVLEEILQAVRGVLSEMNAFASGGTE